MGKTWRTDLDNMVYIIRDEGIHPLTSIKVECDKEYAQRKFMASLRFLLGEVFNKVAIVTIDMEEQLNKAHMKLKGKKTISLDSYYKGTYNLEITRLFEIVNNESKFISLVSRDRNASIEEQINKIEPGDYIIVDDDAVGGRTIKYVTELLGVSRKVVGTYLLMDIFRDKNSQPILDVVDCRDFIAGSTGGLTTLVNGLGIERLPYMYPFIDIEDKANIPYEHVINVSKQLWEMNKQFWIDLGTDIKLKDLGNDFMSVSKYLGLSLEYSMIEVCDIYKNMVDEGLILSK